MGLTERHWFEDEEPELTENQLEDIFWENNKIFERGYQKGFSDGKSALFREQEVMNAIGLLKTQETTLEKDGHHIRCLKCGEYWCDNDREGNPFPMNFCPNCGRKVKWE